MSPRARKSNAGRKPLPDRATLIALLRQPTARAWRPGEIAVVIQRSRPIVHADIDSGVLVTYRLKYGRQWFENLIAHAEAVRYVKARGVDIAQPSA